MQATKRESEPCAELAVVHLACKRRRVTILASAVEKETDVAEHRLDLREMSLSIMLAAWMSLPTG